MYIEYRWEGYTYILVLMRNYNKKNHVQNLHKQCVHAVSLHLASSHIGSIICFVS